MKYMGSKSRIAKHLVPIIQSYIDQVEETNGPDTAIYIEPFVGGANVIDKIKCSHKIGCDINPFLISLLCHVRDGKELPEEITKEEYDYYRDLWKKERDGRHIIPYSQTWEVGCVGFLASYNGRFFDGGYAKPGYEKTKTGERYRDYYKESKANLLSQVPNLQGIKFLRGDYRYLELDKAYNCIVYVDPPYANTKQYNYSLDFDYVEFWNTMRKWSENNIVLISELSAPDDFECIWQMEVSRSIKSKDKSRATEKLFKYKGNSTDRDALGHTQMGWTTGEVINETTNEVIQL